MDMDKIEKRMREIYQEMFDANYSSGAPMIPPHTHNGIDNLKLPASGGGSPGGGDTDIQFNDGSSFGGDPQFTYSKSTGIVHLHDIDNRLATPNDTFELGVTSINGQRLLLTTNNIDADGNLLGPSGDILLASNDSDTYGTGKIDITTGSAHLDGGDITIKTNDVNGDPVDNGTSGDITIKTGFSYDTAGKIKIQAGNSLNGDDGTLDLITNNGPITIYSQGGSGAGTGDVFIGTNAGVIVLQGTLIIMQYHVNIQDSSAPATPGSGGILYANAGALHWLGSGGTDTIVAPA